ncbi:rhodanese-like domain-containing protein 4, chloroplastic [Phalaenopsis equestris]|uniref:rhodanese-like domain-containing protein 4, chloroplastic n=1 Tax=Phalaenopsis equestris TaxID=78828 RepID=UPI0009E4D289|nr:rhodanese-like domain-containing protein 4, chloroplastic [Phalaenopsis equestris]
MKVLNVASLAPVPLPKSSSSKRPLYRIRTLNPSASLFRRFNEGLVSLSSPLCFAGISNALTYDEVLGFSTSSNDFDFARIVDGIVKFGAENPLIVAGGVAVVLVPVIISQTLGRSKSWGVESAKSAYAKLAEDEGVQLLDVREGKELKEVGSPDLRGLKKKAVAISFRREDKAGFLKKLSLKFKDPGNTTLIVIDKFDGNSELVAELLTLNGFKAAFAVKDGAEGPRGWKNSGLPWTSPKKTFLPDFSELTDALSSIGETSDGLPVTIGLAAATGLGLFAFTEIETLLQLLGTAALIQLITKKLLFAEDRKVTLQQVDEFLNTKVAPKELADEIKMIGKALLPIQDTSKASLPAPAESPATTEQNVEAEPALEVNSVPRAELGEPGKPTPLSPYPYYPDFKPPSSPSPSQP